MHTGRQHRTGKTTFIKMNALNVKNVQGSHMIAFIGYRTWIEFYVVFIHSFHWHVQKATIPCRSQELLPFLSVMYYFLPPFSTNYSSVLFHLILPSILDYLSIFLFPNSYIILFWEFSFLPFSVPVQTNLIY